MKEYKNKKNVCCVFNFGSYYRTAIYKLMDKELNCDFYFGDYIHGNIKPMNYYILSGFKGTFKNIWIFGNYYWQKNSLMILNKYNKIILSGEPYCLSSWIILFFAKLMGKKTYVWTHGWYGRENLIKKIIKKIYFRLASHIFLYGNYAKEMMIKEGIDSKKISCIYNSLDYDYQLEIRKNLFPTNVFLDHFNNNAKNLIFVGRLIKSKRIDLLFSAIHNLKKKGHTLNLTLIGNGDIKEYLLLLAEKLEISNNIWFYGETYDDLEISSLLFNADLCVSPGNVGLLAMHSMVYGTPVLTHNNFPFQGPEFEAIKEGITGTFYKHENIDSLANSIIEWFTNNSSREIIRNNCYKIIAEKYNPHFQITLIKSILNL